MYVCVRARARVCVRACTCVYVFMYVCACVCACVRVSLSPPLSLVLSPLPRTRATLTDMLRSCTRARRRCAHSCRAARWERDRRATQLLRCSFSILLNRKRRRCHPRQCWLTPVRRRHWVKLNCPARRGGFQRHAAAPKAEMLQRNSSTVWRWPIVVVERAMQRNHSEPCTHVSDT